MRRLRAGWDAFWYAPQPAVRLDAFRQALLFSLALYMVAWWSHAGEWLTAAGFHPSPAADRVHAPQLPLLPPALVWPVGAALFAGLALAIVGWLRRPAVLVVLAVVIYVSEADPIATFTLNRVYVFSLVVLLLAPAPCPGGQDPKDTLQIGWPVRILQVSFVAHYFAAGVCKAVHGDWLVADDVLWVQVQGLYMTDAAAWLVRTLPAWAFTAQQHAALAFELLAPALLGVRRLRPIGMTVGIVMHLVIAVAMYQLIYFSLQMICFYALFVAPATLARWQRRLG
jgi:hypothetical protein